MRRSTQIPIRSLKERGRSDFEIERIKPGNGELNIYPVDIEHRDDYYIFIYQETGSSTIVVDFQDVVISGNALFCIQPGQIHFGSFTVDTSAWIISVTADWVPLETRLFFMENFSSAAALDITSPEEKEAFNDAMQLFEKFDKHAAILSKQVVQSMCNVCLSLFVQTFQRASETNTKSNLRPALINRQFKSLLLSHFRQMKSPAEYAALLNISPSYLNEAVKETTGYPVSYWIHQEIIMESKRTLFYTNNTVKEIAHALGYSDPSYFIRLFKKMTGTSPQHFRLKYRK
ncbi:AraC family transcriptional regulator [Pedobacter sp. ASV28]|uniref:helix-turn-helix domain-containing protein n=1 Tax=Pedobacter sp. ASV28 TaxID=2795123 RepID=UPI0018EC512D|nr:AraC family transcriptional regulator [Pedobacter sp. ASV28]